MNVEPRHGNALHKAAKLKNSNEAEKIIQNNPSLASQQNANGDTPLHLASRVGCLEIVQLLTKTHEDVEASSDHNNKLLLMTTNDRTETALHDATRNGHFDIVKLLMEVEPNLVSVENGFGESPLYLAVDRKYLDVANYIVRHAHPSECSIKGRNGQNALHAAVIRMQSVHLRVTKRWFLKSKDKRCNLLEDMRRPAKQFIVTLLEKYPLATSKADEHGWLPLHFAAKLGFHEVVDLLIKRDKSSVSVTTNNGMSAIHIAAREGCVRVVEKLVEECEDTSELFDKNHRTPIHCAVESRNSNVVKKIMMIPSFEDLLNEQDIEGNTALLMAANYGLEEIVKLLVEDGRIDKEAVNNEGLGATDIIELHPEVLLKSKASILKVLEGTSSGVALVKSVETEDYTKQSNETVKKKKNIAVERIKKEAAAKLKQLKRESDATVLVATLVATVSFAAVFQMPGGYETEGDNKGMVYLKDKRYFRVFFVADSIAFLFSTATIFISWLSDENHSVQQKVGLAHWFTYVSVLAMAVAFISGTALVLQISKLSIVPYAIYIFIYFLLFGFVVRRSISNKKPQTSAKIQGSGF